ncbi:MAG: metal-sulfur cluster assembly factor [Gemmatimonadota bacterium]|nr:metal-sulfur cluster assembly factor [Gemmatimonadota bacterium]
MSDQELGVPAGGAGAPGQQAATDDGMPAPPADAPPGDGAAGGAVTEDQVKAALRKVKDPELNLNIVDLGLIYAIAVEGSRVSIDMSLTSPGCPSGPEIMTSAEEQLRAMPGVEDVAMNLVWQPFWTPDRIEPRIRSYLGL